MARGVEPGHRLIDGGLIERAVRLVWVDNLARLDRRGAAKDHEVDQGVRSEAVGTVDGGATRLAHRHQAGLERVRVVRRRVQRLPPVIGRDAAHVVVDGRDDRDRLLVHVNAGENLGAFRNTRQAFSQRLRRQVVQVKVDMVAIGAHAAAFADFHRHAARNNVARGEILGGGRVAFHEPLALGVDEVSALAPGAFGDEAAGPVDAGRVELYELHILQRQALPRDHAAAVAGAGMGRSGGEIGAAITAGRQHHHLGGEPVHRSVVQLPRDDALADAVFGHDEVKREILDIEFRVVLQRLSVERVQNGVTGAVGGGAGALHRRAVAKFRHMAAERALIDLAFFGAGERHAVMVKLIDRLRRLAGEVFHRVRIAEPVGALHRVIKVPLPVVRSHVRQRCGDAALRRDCVGPGRKDLGDAGGAQPLLRHAERCAKPRSAGAYDDDVVFVIDEIVCGHVSPLSRPRRRKGARRPVSARKGDLGDGKNAGEGEGGAAEAVQDQQRLAHRAMHVILNDHLYAEAQMVEADKDKECGDDRVDRVLIKRQHRLIPVANGHREGKDEEHAKRHERDGGQPLMPPVIGAFLGGAVVVGAGAVGEKAHVRVPLKSPDREG